MMEGDNRQGDRITEMWAWTAVDPKDDCEGVLALLTPPLPLVGGDRERIESFRNYAEAIGNANGQAIRLLRFSNVEVVEQVGYTR